MKRNLLIFFLIFTINAFSQNEEKSIVLKDVDTNEPIEDVTVYIAKTKQTAPDALVVLYIIYFIKRAFFGIAGKKTGFVNHTQVGDTPEIVAPVYVLN